MSGNTYGNLCKYTVMRSKKAFKAPPVVKYTNSIPKQPKSSLHVKDIKSLSKNQKNVIKT